MRILGIHNNDLASACLVSGGQVVAAVSEERFTRKKDHQGWPAHSIAYVLQAGGISLEQVDHIAYGWNAGFNSDKHLLLYFDRIVAETLNNPNGLHAMRKRIADEIHNDKEKRAEFDAFVTKNGFNDKAIYIDHHECHALGAYVCSPFDDALVVTCDGRGDFQSLTVSRYGPQGGKVLQRETSIDSLGYFYGRVTELLGYKPNRHEGKITGLAAYGNAQKTLPLFRRMIEVENGRLIARCGEFFLPSYTGYSEQLKQAIAAHTPADLAAGAQRHTENLLTKVVNQHIIAGGENLCLAGGVFGNVKLNQRLREIPGIKNVYVLPPMGDGGLALAAAVGVAFQKQGTRFKRLSMALGPQAVTSHDEFEQYARQLEEIDYCEPSNLVDTLVNALRHNQVLGMFKGRMEFGPRALGNRSIIYHTADKTANDWLNKRMHRTEFMPFAPISAEEHAALAYVGWEPDHATAEFMTMTYDCTSTFVALCPAVVHVDGTARPQVVRQQADPFMHALLLAWHKASGQLALINTSFNAHEEPIVCSITDALSSLRTGMVDLVVINQRYLAWNKLKNHYANEHLTSLGHNKAVMAH